MHDPYAEEPQKLMQRFNYFENKLRNVHLCAITALAIDERRDNGDVGPVYIVHGLGHHYDCQDVIESLVTL